jgi:hypothetical protein
LAFPCGLSPVHQFSSGFGSRRFTHTIVPSRLLQRHADYDAAFTTSVPKYLGFQAPLMGFLQRSPLRRHQSKWMRLASQGLRLPHLKHAPSMLFLAASTSHSTQILRAYCISLPTRGLPDFMPNVKPRKALNRQSHKHIARPSKLFPRHWTAVHHCKTPKHSTLTAHRFPLVLSPPCCHVLPEPQGFDPKPSPLPITVLPLIPARCSLGLPRLTSFHSEYILAMTEITVIMHRFKHRNA